MKNPNSGRIMENFAIGDPVEMTLYGVTKAGRNWAGASGMVTRIHRTKIAVSCRGATMKWPKSYWQKTEPRDIDHIHAPGDKVQLSKHAIEQGCTQEILGANTAEVLKVLPNGLIRVQVRGHVGAIDHPASFWEPE